MKITKTYGLIIGISILIILLIPILMRSYVFEATTLSDLNKNNWAAFLGGYIGGVLTLIGVHITIINLNNENAKVNELNRQQTLEDRRVNVLPFLTYYFKKMDLPGSYSHIPIGVEHCDIDDRNIKECCALYINNFGLKAAYDVSYRLYVDGKDSQYTEKIVDLIPIEREYKHEPLVFILPKLQDIVGSSKDFNISFVVFYKDLLMNQYAQEIPGHAYINITDKDSNAYISNISFMDPLPPKQIFDEISYSLDNRQVKGNDLDKYINSISNRYNYYPDEELGESISMMCKKLIDSFENKLLNQAKKALGVPHLEMGRGRTIGFKKKSDENWETVYFSERGYTIDKSIVYFLTLELDMKRRIYKVADIEIYENDLTENKKVTSKFNAKIKRLKWKINWEENRCINI